MKCTRPKIMQDDYPRGGRCSIKGKGGGYGWIRTAPKEKNVNGGKKGASNSRLSPAIGGKNRTTREGRGTSSKRGGIKSPRLPADA